MAEADMGHNSLLSLPVFVINMDRCVDRLQATMKNIKDAGFMNINRFRAVDATNPDELATAWKVHGDPQFDPARIEFVKYKGEQGCMLSHLNAWKHIIDNKIPMAVVFEDDVYFHKDWEKLSKLYWGSTPPPPMWDILFMGNQMEIKAPGEILRVPVYCSHAYVLTLNGAQRLYNHVLSKSAFPNGICAIDCLLIETMWKLCMQQTPITESAPFNWLVWNGTMFRDERATIDPEWTKRNTGIVFQDHTFGTDVRPRVRT